MDTCSIIETPEDNLVVYILDVLDTIGLSDQGRNHLVENLVDASEQNVRRAADFLSRHEFVDCTTVAHINDILEG